MSKKREKVSMQEVGRWECPTCGAERYAEKHDDMLPKANLECGACGQKVKVVEVWRY